MDTSRAPRLDGHPLDDPDFRLTWPREIFLEEAEILRNDSNSDRQEWLCVEAFDGPLPSEIVRKFGTNAWGDSDRTPNSAFAFIIDNVDCLRIKQLPTPYWRARHAAPDPDEPTTVELLPLYFKYLVDDLADHGYFERSFPRECVDFGRSRERRTLPESMRIALQWSPSWPLDANQLNNRDNLFDIIEYLHDVVARPRKRWYHEFADCGWHYEDFSRTKGQILYRASVNELLADAGINFRLADDGANRGRLVSITDDARSDLIRESLTRKDADHQIVEHAIDLFRSRRASTEEKRSACIALAGVLESHRGEFEANHLSEDDSALFVIANKFAIRHQNKQQRSDYDEAFLDFIFWWYLAYVELLAKLRSRKP